MMLSTLVALSALAMSQEGSSSDRKKGAPPGPDRAFLRDSAETRGYLLGRPSGIKLTPDGKSVLFLRSPPRSPALSLFEHAVETGETREVLTPDQILKGAEETLSAAEKARRERMRVSARGFTSFELSRDGRRLLVPLSGKLYAVEREKGSVRTVYGGTVPVIAPRLSPDGASVSYVKDNDVFVAEVATGKERRVTKGGTYEIPHGLAEFVAQEEMDRFEGLFWSPDSSSLAYAEVDHRGMERFAIADPARPEKGAEAFFYPRPGKANAKVRLGIVPASGGKTVWVRWDAERYPYLARVIWKEKKAPLTLLVQTRDQREAALLTVERTSGATKVLHVEKDDAWLNLETDTPRWLADGSGFLVVSERSGRRELELRDGRGELVRVVVQGEQGYVRLAHLDEKTRELIAVCARHPARAQIVRFSIDGKAPVPMTDDALEHSPVFSEDGAVFVDTVTGVDRLPSSEVRRADGRTLASLPSVAETPAFRAVAELLTVEVPDGREALTYHAAVLRPRGFEPSRKYPVILSVYGGPHHNVVVSDERAFLMGQWIADHGALVVSLDNRGTLRRGRTWERAIKGSFGSVPLDDQVAGLRALSAKIPQMDLSRVGIYGWSFGGYLSALAVLRRPEVFKVAVAGAPVVDWRDYDTHYTERYLSVPETNEKGYDESSLLTYAPSLSRPLLLIHGTGDDNVYFFHTLKLADALFKSGRAADLLPLSGFTHMVADPLIRERLYGRIVAYLFDHLRG